MHSTFSRALFGFIALSTAIVLMALVALWSINTFTDGLWWGSLMVIIVAMVVEVGVYSSTLHEPIYDWIKEPERQRLLSEERERDAERERKAQAERLARDAEPPDIHEDRIG